MNLIHITVFLALGALLILVVKKSAIITWWQERWRQHFHQMMDEMYHPREVALAAANDPNGWDRAWAVGFIKTRTTWNWPKRVVAVHVTAHHTGMKGKIENKLYYCKINWYGKILQQHLVAESEFSGCDYHNGWGNDDPARNDLYPAMVQPGKMGIALANRHFDQRFFHWTAGGEYQIPQDALHMLLTTM